MQTNPELPSSKEPRAILPSEARQVGEAPVAAVFDIPAGNRAVEALLEHMAVLGY